MVVLQELKCAVAAKVGGICGVAVDLECTCGGVIGEGDESVVFDGAA